jgi:hypothetical protein
MAWARVPQWLKVAAVVLLALWGFGELRWQAGFHARDVEVQGLKDALTAVKAAQAKANRAAKANQLTKAVAHAGNAKEVTDANDKGHADAGRAADALRVRIKELERAARGGAVPGAGGATGAADAEVERRLSLADELALRESCEALRLDHDALIDWENGRLAIERVPAIVP